MSDAGQFGQAVAKCGGDLTYTVHEVWGMCYVCGESKYGVIREIGMAKWLCEKHWFEYLRGDTDWWELIRLMRNA